MKIRLLKRGNDFKSSPERSVYSIAKNSSDRYQLIVPIDIWFLENDISSRENDQGKLRPLPNSWKGFEIGVPGNTSGIGTLLGEPPNSTMGDFSPAISCLANSNFNLFTDEQKRVENATKLSVFPDDKVTAGLKVAIGKFPGEVVRTDVDFSPTFLSAMALMTRTIKVYQLRMTSRIGYRMIGTPVITEAFSGAPLERLGMLIDVNNQSNGECIASVVPGSSIEKSLGGSLI